MHLQQEQQLLWREGPIGEREKKVLLMVNECKQIQRMPGVLTLYGGETIYGTKFKMFLELEHGNRVEVKWKKH